MLTLFFLDDERNFDDVTWIKYPHVDKIITVRSTSEFIKHVLNFDMKDGAIFSFDHDICDFHDDEEFTGYDCLKWLCDHIIDKYGDVAEISKSIDVVVHSKNPIGKKNIEEYYKNFIEFFS